MKRRAIFFFALYIFGCSLVLLRISTVSTMEEYAAAVDRQSSWRLTVGESRGVLYDRNLTPLNRSTQPVAAVVSSPDSVAALSGVLPLEERRAAASLLQQSKPFLFPLSQQAAEALEQSGDLLLFERVAASDPIAAHLVGYTNENGGVTGLEAAFDSYLQQHSGRLSVVYRVNAYGEAFAGVEPQVDDENYLDPQGVVLTLDSAYQRMAEEAAESLEQGAIVLLNAETGAILASASRPGYTVDTLADLLDSPDGPLLNRALLAYPVGSAFKVLVAAAALESGFSPDTVFTCTGAVTVDGHVYHCHDREGHGDLDLPGALAESCNAYFIQLGQALGGETLLRFAERFGFGQPCFLAEGLQGAAGTLPAADTLHGGALALFSFGQGELTATPLQVASMMAVVANGGRAVSPYLVEGFTDEDGRFTAQQTAASDSPRLLGAQTDALLRQYLTDAVGEGTGRRARVSGLTVGGKTGSAQTGRYDEAGNERVEAWFAGYFTTPQGVYAAVVFAEDGGEGSLTAAPVFSALAGKIAAYDTRRWLDTLPPAGTGAREAVR